MPQALPGASVSTPPAAGFAPQQMRVGNAARVGSGSPILRVVSPTELDAQEQAKQALATEANRRAAAPPDDLGAFIRNRWTQFRNHRNQGNNPINERLLRAQRMFEGKYDPVKLQDIKRFGGSEVYSRLVAVKCRGAKSLLRDVYLGAQRPWDIKPQADPPVPPDVQANVLMLLSTEVSTQQQAGAPVTPDQAHMRYVNLMHAAQQAARRNALLQAGSAGDKIEDILRAGNFYSALDEFLTDLPLFPFACIKGPIVRMVPKLSWENGRPMLRNKPQMFWERKSPFDISWSPGVARIADAEILERQRLTRADLNALLGLPGYDEAAIRSALQDYDNGLRDWLDWPDMERALNEVRENPALNVSHMIDALEYHGNVQGHILLQQGVDPKRIPDLDRDYAVQSWVVGRYTIKTQLNPSPKQRHPYYLTSFEKVPGTVMGHGLPDILEDLQDICNATLRALVNNMGMASGPQAVIRTDMLSPSENEDEMYPWKRWKVMGDMIGSAQGAPVTFFQPQSNAQELLTVYRAVSDIADDISAIPRYITGESLSGGAGRTASGLSMLMGNSSKVLQTVAANVDTDVMEPVLTGLYDMIMLTDQSGLLTGEEQIMVNGVNVAVQKETDRQKRLQFLQITANPVDQEIVGELGRARVLRAVAADDLNLPDDVVPDDQTIQDKLRAQQQAGAMMVAAGTVPPPGQQPQQPGSQAGRAAGSQPPHPTPARLADHAPPVNMFQQQSQPKQGVNTHGA